MMGYSFRFVSALLLFLFASVSFAAIEVHEFASEVDRLRYQSFIEELRCPKCENQNLAGSNSPIALDLREELYEMISSGRSDREIIDFMVARYGEFILYRPTFSAATAFLWLLPAVLLITGALVLTLMVRRRRQAMGELETGLSVSEQAQLAQLLTKNSSDAKSNINNKQGEK